MYIKSLLGPRETGIRKDVHNKGGEGEEVVRLMFHKGTGICSRRNPSKDTGVSSANPPRRLTRVPTKTSGPEW